MRLLPNRVESACFLFIGSHCFTVVHIFSISPPQTEFQRIALVLGLSIFSFLQFGGSWILSLAGISLSGKKIVGIRFVGIFLLLFNSPFVIFSALVCLGISYSAYYQILRKEQSVVAHAGAGNFFRLNISQNLSFLILPAICAIVLQSGGSGIVLIFGAILWAASIAALWPNTPVAITSGTYDQSMLSINPGPNAHLTGDCASIFMLVVSYSLGMVSMQSFGNVSSEGAHVVSLLFGVNAFVVMIIQCIFARTNIAENIQEKHIVGALITLWIATFGILANLDREIKTYLLLSIVLWSAMEAMIIPHMEHRIFKVRKYNTRQINFILAVDGFAALSGPLIFVPLYGYL